MSRVGDVLRKMVDRVRPHPSPPDRLISTREDAQRRRRIAESLEHRARMLGVDVDLQRAGR